MTTTPNSDSAPQANAQPQHVTINTAPAPRDFPEMPYSANVRATDVNGFEWQFTARAVNESPFAERIARLQKYLLANNFKPTPSRGGATTTVNTASESPIEPAPLCAIHKEPMAKRQGKNGQSFWSCPKKLDNGDWCPYRPK